MRRPDVAVAHSSPARSSSICVRSSSGALPPPPTADNSSGGWTLPPLDQFMTLPSRFITSRFGGSADSSAISSSNSNNTNDSNSNSALAGDNTGSNVPGTDATLDTLLNEDETGDWGTHNHFVLPRMVHFEDEYEPSNSNNTSPAQPPEEIDLTVSSSEDEGRGQGTAATGDSDDVIEILDVSEASGVPQPAPLRRKRRRPAPVIATKRQCMTDIVRSAASTDVSIHNSEVVEEFKGRLKCSICLDGLEDMTSTICGHVFCAECIHQAIRANGKCPLCQRRLHLKDIHRLFF